MSLFKSLDKWTGGDIADWLASKIGGGYEVVGQIEIDLATITEDELKKLRPHMRPEDYEKLVRQVQEYRR